MGKYLVGNFKWRENLGKVPAKVYRLERAKFKSNVNFRWQLGHDRITLIIQKKSGLSRKSDSYGGRVSLRQAVNLRWDSFSPSALHFVSQTLQSPMKPNGSFWSGKINQLSFNLFCIRGNK